MTGRSLRGLSPSRQKCSCVKKPNAIREEKWGAKAQLETSGGMLPALIAARKSFSARITAQSPTIIIDAVLGGIKTNVYPAGKSTPDWAQRLAKDAFRVICDVSSTLYLFRG